MNSASFIRLYARCLCTTVLLYTVYEGVTFRGPRSCLGVFIAR